MEKSALDHCQGMTGVTWEHLFREHPVSSVRTQLKNFEKSIEDETKASQNAVGSKYPELIALAHRLESLKALGTDLEDHVSNFAAESVELTLPKHFNLSSVDVDSKVLEKLKKLLISLADRSLVQQKFATCAHAIYLCKALDVSSDDLEKVSSELDTQLNNWLSEQTHLPQTLYNAYLIHFRVTPGELLRRFLQMRKQRIDYLLTTSITEAFKCMDSTTFIYDQVVSDLSQSRLTQRRLVDLAEFNEPTLSHLIKISAQYHPNVLSFRAYPSESYQPLTESELSNSRLEPFIHDVSKSMSSSDVFSASSSEELVSILSSIVSQAQSALSAETSMALLLQSLLPVFAASLKTQIDYQLTNTPSTVAATVEGLRNELDQITKLSHHMNHFAPDSANTLLSTVSESSKYISEWVNKHYEQQFAELAKDSQSENLFQLTSQVKSLHDLNQTFTRLGGSPSRIPEPLYDRVAKLLLAEWERVRNYWGDPLVTGLWDLQLLQDKYEISYWEDDGLKYIRKILLKNLALRAKEPNGDFISKAANGAGDDNGVLPEVENVQNGTEPSTENTENTENSNDTAANNENGSKSKKNGKQKTSGKNKKKNKNSNKNGPGEPNEEKDDKMDNENSADPEKSSDSENNTSPEKSDPQKSDPQKIVISSRSSLLLHPLYEQI